MKESERKGKERTNSSFFKKNLIVTNLFISKLGSPEKATISYSA